MTYATEAPRTLDRAYIEWSERTSARTNRELCAGDKIQHVIETLQRIRRPEKGEFVDMPTLIDSAVLQLQSILTTLK